MKNIKGPVAYFRNVLYDLLAIFKSLGPPTLFVTLSADDLHWPELGMTLQNIDFKDAFGKSFFQSMRKDPLLAATHFDRRFRALQKHVILGKTKPLGTVLDYFARIEFQNRGSPHVHMFLWIDGLPAELNHSTASEFIHYIDRTISSNVPSLEEDYELNLLVKKLQTHHPSAYCSHGYKSNCRFGFPRKVVSTTRILPNNDLLGKSKAKLYETKRNQESIFINVYNKVLLRHWRANIIKNAEGAAYYVCSYLCKSEPDDLKNALGNLIYSIFKQNLNLSKYQKLLQIGLCVLKHRRMSAQEAAYRLGNLHLIHSTRKVVHINTRFPTKRFKMLKPKIFIEEMNDNCTDIFYTNLMDYYHKRPHDLESYSFYRFASWYEKCTPPKGPLNRKACERIYIDKHNVWLKKRTKPVVLRYPNFALFSGDYFYSFILLLLPHRNEEQLLSGHDSAKAAFFCNMYLILVSIFSMYH